MKICFVHEEYPEETNFGGIATYQKIMAEYYANHGDDVYVITRGKNYKDYIENRVHIIRVAADNNNDSIISVKNYRREVAKILTKLQSKDMIDIIETPDWGANTIYFEHYRKVPIIVRLHTPLKIWLNYNNNNFGKSKDIILKWEKTMLKKADAITSCSELLKKMVIKEYKINKEITTIPNPYDNKNFNVTTKTNNNNLIYVGSLEERKGVILLAKALNVVLSVIDNSLVYIVGKDTNRNSKNISTKKYMLSLISQEYHHRINFVGQVTNNEVNEYLNKAYLAIFPSSFDNYPYTILEAMASGKNIVCSDNIGSIDLIKQNNYVYETNNLDDLINKIMLALENKKDFINYNNIKLVNEACSQDYVCKKMRNIYLKTIEKYNKNHLEENEMKIALKSVICFNKITKISKACKNLANIVYIVFTDVGNFIVKKYNYNYDFDLCGKLYNIYEINDIKIVRPINNKILNINGNKYNIFKYIKPSFGTLQQDYIKKIINIDRKTNIKSNVLEKCNKYYDYLSGLGNYNKLIEKDEKFAMQKYKEIKDMLIFNEQYLNHGDLSLNNIIFSGKVPYIIDFDETCVTTKLYDYAVLFIKFYIKNINLSCDNILNYIFLTMPDDSYTLEQYLAVIKFYLCKILLEKFYLYEIKKIDLFSENQLKDNYNQYVNILKLICDCEVLNE